MIKPEKYFKNAQASPSNVVRDLKEKRFLRAHTANQTNIEIYF